MRRALLLAISLWPSLALGATTRVLIPTRYGGAGAFGSSWATYVVVYNLSDKAISSPGVLFQCPIPDRCAAGRLDPGEFGSVVTPPAPSGILLYIDGDESRVWFTARFAAAPRNPMFGGTELPIVREREFRDSPLILSDVPFPDATNRFRTTLRIYGLTALRGTAVRVELRQRTSLAGDAQFAKTYVLTVPLTPPDLVVPIFPGYAEINLRADFPEAVSDFYNVTVVPLPLALGSDVIVPKVWAFVSITDNRTQEVTVQRPQ